MTLLNAPFEIFGTEWEVYLFLLILGFPIFFLTRWFVRKFTKLKWSRILLTWLGTIILTPIIYGLIGLIIVEIISYYPNHDFDKKEWAANPDKRYELSKDIIKSKILIGKTKPEVRQILGDDNDNTDTTDYWIYSLGYKPELFNIDPDLLSIEFKNGKVESVSQSKE